jgi:hypothetical protein
MRGALPTATLVELHNQVAIGIEVASTTRAETRAGPTMDYQRGFAERITTGLPIDEVVIAHFE